MVFILCLDMFAGFRCPVEVEFPTVLEDFLVSEYLLKALPRSSDFTLNAIGTTQLRGRQAPVEVYSVRRSSPEVLRGLLVAIG